RESNKKRQTPARRVEQSFLLHFPTGQHQTEQTEKSSYCEPSQRELKCRPEPERHEKGNEKKEEGREAGHPHVHCRDPTASLAPRSTGAVTQSEREQDHASESEHDKKQKSKENYRHSRF